MSLVTDSRLVRPGDTFICLSNNPVHCEEARDRGASYVIGTESVRCEGVPFVVEEHPRLYLARNLSEMPRPEYGYAVTGTNGKSSVVHYLHQFWTHWKIPHAVIGTLGVKTNIAYEAPPFSLTTPDPILLHRILADLAERGVTHFACEASSHGLDQYRLHGCDFYGVAFTNLSPDHLDYHPTMEDYFAAKRRLFEDFHPTIRVRNANDPYGRRLEGMAYGPGTPFWYDETHMYWHDVRIPLEKLPLLGSFQYENLLCASLLVAEHEPFLWWEHIQPPRGRMEKILQRPLVIVDYAHTPDGMLRVLQTLRHTGRKLWVVFGCGGNRDAQKRPLMGQIAQQWADEVRITNDNPRWEDPQAIAEAIQLACPKGKIILDRREAIYDVLAHAAPEDCVAILGKGHESTQIIQDQIIEMDDAEIVRSYYA